MENIIFEYIVKVSLSITLFYALYMIFLRKDTFFKVKRLYLLLAIVASFIYPFITIDVAEITQNNALVGYLHTGVIITNDNASLSPSIPFTVLDGVTIALLAGISFFIVRFILQLLFVVKMLKNTEICRHGKYHIIYVRQSQFSSFSFFNLIFINTENDNESTDEVLTHELIHANQWHSLDILFVELFCILFWWNPITWLLKREIKTNLEYLADEGVLNNGFSKKSYQYTLLQFSIRNTGITMINNFNVSQLKKRITMMNKKKTSRIVSAKYLFAIPLFAILLAGNTLQASSAKDNTSVQSVNTDLESGPQFPGGASELSKFIAMNLRYPVEAQNADVQGLVLVSFDITTTGETSNIVFLKSIGVVCEEEVTRMVKAMPKWIPAEKDGKKIAGNYVLPIVFKLSGSDKKIESTNQDNEIVVVGYKAE